MIHYDHIGTNEDGTPRFNIWSDIPNAHLVMTGPIIGTVDIDGSPVDVSAPFIEVPDEETALKISDAIGLRHVQEGHPDFVNDKSIDEDGLPVDDFGFVHVTADGTPYINNAARPDTVAKAVAKIEASPLLETGSLVMVEV
jgi:hypothetical protein